MKYIVPIILIIAFSCNSQNKKETAENQQKEKIREVEKQKEINFDKEQAVLHIREMFNSINEQAKNAEVVEKDIMKESAEGGQLKAYKYNGKIIKLVKMAFGETGKATKEYYLENEKLIFAFTKEEYYDKPMYVEGSKISKTVENRYYFNNGKLFKWVDQDKNEVDLSTTENTSEEILSDVKYYLSQVN